MQPLATRPTIASHPKFSNFRRDPASRHPSLPPTSLQHHGRLISHQTAGASSAATSSESEDADAGPSTLFAMPIDPAALAAAEESIAQQQSGGLPPPYSLDDTRRIVETAMLAAVAGLSYTMATLLKLEGYLSYVLPLPIVLAALRGGASAAVKCLVVAFLLLFILVGPVKAVSYLLIYGLLSVAMGASWSLRLPWALSVPAAAVARMAGAFGYISLSSIMTNENLLALMVTNLHSMLDQFTVKLGGAGAPSMMAVGVTLVVLLLVQSVFYVSMMHILYTLILRTMGYDTGPAPKFLNKILGNQNDSLA